LQKASFLQFFCTRFGDIKLALLKDTPMASLQKKGESYYCHFMFHGKRHTFTVGEGTQLRIQLGVIPVGCFETGLEAVVAKEAELREMTKTLKNWANLAA
jgi:hypothetical protein